MGPFCLFLVSWIVIYTNNNRWYWLIVINFINESVIKHWCVAYSWSESLEFAWDDGSCEIFVVNFAINWFSVFQDLFCLIFVQWLSEGPHNFLQVWFADIPVFISIINIFYLHQKRQMLSEVLPHGQSNFVFWQNQVPPQQNFSLKIGPLSGDPPAFLTYRYLDRWGTCELNVSIWLYWLRVYVGRL